MLVRGTGAAAAAALHPLRSLEARSTGLQKGYTVSSNLMRVMLFIPVFLAMLFAAAIRDICNAFVKYFSMSGFA
jgi:hypothetical protein